MMRSHRDDSAKSGRAINVVDKGKEKGQGEGGRGNWVCHFASIDARKKNQKCANSSIEVNEHPEKKQQ